MAIELSVKKHTVIYNDKSHECTFINTTFLLNVIILWGWLFNSIN